MGRERGEGAEAQETVGRRRLLTGGLALGGAAAASLIAADTAAATPFELDVTNDITASTRLRGSIAGTCAFGAFNDYPVGISRHDGILGRTRYTTSNCAGVAGSCEAASRGIGVLGTSVARDGTGVYGFAGSNVPSEVPTNGAGVQGTGPVAGVAGRSTAGSGVRGTTETGTAVEGIATRGGLAARLQGDARVEGALAVTAGATVAALAVGGASAIGAGLDVAGAATLRGGAEIAGQARAGALTVEGAAAASTLAVAGEASAGALAVAGEASAARLAVSGEARLTGPVALGPTATPAATADRLALPKTSGVATLRRAAGSVSVRGLALSSGSLVVATLQRHRRGLFVVAAVPSPRSGRVTIHFNRRAPRGTKVAWVVVN